MKWDRVRQANAVIKIISSHGRRFFYSEAYGRTGYFGLDRVGQVWYVDQHTGMKLYPFGNGYWVGFTHGGTLQVLIARLAQFIETAEQLDLAWFPLEHDAELWAYGQEAMTEVRRLVLETEAVRKE
jgi:hypothetical protein